MAIGETIEFRKIGNELGGKTMNKQYLFKKGTKQIYEVYNIRNDKNGYPHVLVYNYYGQGEWEYVSMKHFEPMK